MDTDNAQLFDEFPPSCRLSMLTFGACQDTPIIQATTTVGLRNTRYLQKNCPSCSLIKSALKNPLQQKPLVT